MSKDSVNAQNEIGDGRVKFFVRACATEVRFVQNEKQLLRVIKQHCRPNSPVSVYQYRPDELADDKGFAEMRVFGPDNEFIWQRVN